MKYILRRLPFIHLRDVAASGECVMLCGYRPFLPFFKREPTFPRICICGISITREHGRSSYRGAIRTRGRNELHTIFDHHFPDFCEQYDEKYASKYGMFRLERIQQIGERFSTCGDYLQGIARVRCTNPECGYDYFRPFSYKGFYLCPSCSQKRTLLFAEHLSNDVLLNLPHRQFVFSIPRALRPFFRRWRPRTIVACSLSCRA